MILSSSDILRIISSDPIIRVSARVKITEARSPIDTGDTTVIYISKYPTVSDVQAVWNIWIIDNSNEPLDIILAQLRRLLPGFAITSQGIVIKATVTELKSANTETAPESPVKQEQGLLGVLQARFDELKQSIEDRMLLVGPGRPGKDGEPGKDGLPGQNGKDGANGKDLVATDAVLDDLKDVFVADAKKGQVLTFDGASWVSRFVPQLLKGGSGSAIPEPPDDGRYYTRIIVDGKGQWVDLLTAIRSLNLDAGDFD